MHLLFMFFQFAIGAQFLAAGIEMLSVTYPLIIALAFTFTGVAWLATSLGRYRRNICDPYCNDFITRALLTISTLMHLSGGVLFALALCGIGLPAGFKFAIFDFMFTVITASISLILGLEHLTLVYGDIGTLINSLFSAIGSAIANVFSSLFEIIAYPFRAKPMYEVDARGNKLGTDENCIGNNPRIKRLVTERIIPRADDELVKAVEQQNLHFPIFRDEYLKDPLGYKPKLIKMTFEDLLERFKASPLPDDILRTDAFEKAAEENHLIDNFNHGVIMDDPGHICMLAKGHWSDHSPTHNGEQARANGVEGLTDRSFLNKWWRSHKDKSKVAHPIPGTKWGGCQEFISNDEAKKNAQRLKFQMASELATTAQKNFRRVNGGVSSRGENQAIERDANPCYKL